MRSTNTWPEVLLVDSLDQLGLTHVSRHVRQLPGTPDIVFREARTAVFVHGCFWHRHLNCAQATTPRANRLRWVRSFAETVQRDQHVVLALHQDRWATYVAWECEILRDADSVARDVKRLLDLRAYAIAP